METATKTKQAPLTKFKAARQKVNQLLSLKKMSLQDIEDLDQIERDYLEETATKKLQQLTGDERDSFIEKIEAIVPVSTKNQLWEHNQMVISNAISQFISKHGFMPTKSFIADETGLSRPTVVKHVKEYKTHPEYLAAVQQFKFMAPNVLASVFKFAINGDTKAARLYFEMVGAINKQQPGRVVTEQNNYIQINNTILSQENLRSLSAEQLNQIEHIITNGTGK
jgi:predicted transcriptional regulator